VIRTFLFSYSWRNLLCWFYLHVVTLCTFPFVFSCSVVLFNFAVSCVCDCLLAFSCCLFVSCCYLLSVRNMDFAGYVAVCVQLYCRCFTVLHLVVAALHYMFRPTWPSSSVYDVSLLYSWRNLLRCFCCLFLHVVILCTFPFVFFCCVFSLIFWFLCVCVCVCVRERERARERASEWAWLFLLSVGFVLQNLKTYWTIQCSRMLKYSIRWSVSELFDTNIILPRIFPL
jgi:hypothetical protein